jgi:hypothetical protein
METAEEFPNHMIEEIARTLRTTSYAYKGMTAQIMVEAAKSRNPAVLKKWDTKWKEIQWSLLLALCTEQPVPNLTFGTTNDAWFHFGD